MPHFEVPEKCVLVEIIYPDTSIIVPFDDELVKATAVELVFNSKTSTKMKKFTKDHDFTKDSIYWVCENCNMRISDKTYRELESKK